MAATAQLSDAVAYSASYGGYYDPLTMAPIDELTGEFLVNQAHQFGEIVDGIDGTGANWQSFPAGDAAIDAATNQAHLNAAAAQALVASGLAGKEKGRWLQSEAVDYISRFKAIILANREAFTPATVQIAENIHITADYLGDDAGRKLIDPNQIAVFVTDTIAPAVEMVAPLAQIPSVIANASQTTLNAASSVLNAVNNAAKALDSTGKYADLILPVAFLGFLWFAVRSIGKDPAGQAGKFISSFR